MARSTVYIFQLFVFKLWCASAYLKMQIDRDNEEGHNVMRRFLPLVLPLSHLNHKQQETNYN